MKINLKLLDKWYACRDGLKWFKNRYGNESVDHLKVLSDIRFARGEWSTGIGDGNYLWLMNRIFHHSAKECEYIHFVITQFGHKRAFFFLNGETKCLSDSFIFRYEFDLARAHPKVTEEMLTVWFKEIE